MAADLRAKAPVYKAPAPVVVSNWTGFYAGFGVGGRWMENDWTTTATFAPFTGTPTSVHDRSERVVFERLIQGQRLCRL